MGTGRYVDPRLGSRLLLYLQKHQTHWKGKYRCFCFPISDQLLVIPLWMVSLFPCKITKEVQSEKLFLTHEF